MRKTPVSTFPILHSIIRCSLKECGSSATPKSAGSITDVSQFTCTIDKVTEYGYKNAGFILDRGYFSKDNIRYMESEGYAFIIMVKGCKELVSSLVLDHRNTFETNREHSIRSYRVYGKTVKSKLYEDGHACDQSHP